MSKDLVNFKNETVRRNAIKELENIIKSVKNKKVNYISLVVETDENVMPMFIKLGDMRTFFRGLGTLELLKKQMIKTIQNELREDS